MDFKFGISTEKMWEIGICDTNVNFEPPLLEKSNSEIEKPQKIGNENDSSYSVSPVRKKCLICNKIDHIPTIKKGAIH